MSEQIILFEPQCRDYEHVQFNAPLLYTALLAYPEAQITLIGEREHVERVRAVLEQTAPQEAQRVVWRIAAIPSRDLSGWARLGLEWRGCLEVLRLASKESARFLGFCSIGSAGLLALKALMFWRKVSLPVLVIPHSILNYVVPQKTGRLWDRSASFRRVLLLPHPGSLRYVVLGESIFRSLVEALPQMRDHFSALDLPFLWPEGASESAVNPAAVRFGYFGVSTGKGFDLFVRLAAQVRARYPRAEFELVGFLSTPADRREYGDFPGASDTLLSPEEYRQRAESLTYAVWTARPERYRLAASTSFLDALAYAKPGIYLRGPYIEYYFGRMGDIGYLCDSEEEMLDQMFSILAAFPAERYQAQRENILRARSIFEPATLAPQLRAIVSACERQ